jgi:propanediol dehydratase large subunit
LSVYLPSISADRPRWDVLFVRTAVSRLDAIPDVVIFMDQDTNAAIEPRNETVVMAGTNLHFTDVDDHSWSKGIHRNVNARQRFRQSGRTSDEIIAETDQSGQSEEKQR